MDNKTTEKARKNGADLPSAERILEAATELFATHGFDGVSTRQIASAVGLNIATVAYHTGSKEALYREVFRRLYRREEALLESFIARVDEGVIHDRAALRDLLEHLVDALVTMTVEQPEVPRLWVRRWLDKRRANDDLEAEVSLPLFQMVRQLLERAQRAGTLRAEGLDLALFLKSFTWMLYGYDMSGPLDWNAARADPNDPAQIDSFKRFLHDYLCRMLNL